MDANPPLPPRHMPAWRGTRPLKRWRYVAVFDRRLVLCAGDVKVGPARQTFWALWDRQSERLHERTGWLRHGHVALEPGRLRVTGGDVWVDIELEEDEGVEVVCPHGRGYVWTRKQGGVPARGRVSVDGRTIAVDALAVVDDTAGYHARETEWRWSAGVGEDPDGGRLAWNLVEGVNDPATGSERTLWVDGSARELGPVSFDPSLASVSFAEGGELRFVAEAERARRDNLLIMRSDYRAPFGRFRGVFPGGLELARGLGVMEHHLARW